MAPGAAHTRGTHHACMVWWFGTPMWVHWVGVPRRPQLKMPGVRPNMASNHHPSTPTAAVGPMGVVVSRIGWCAGRYGAPAGPYGSIRAIWGGTAVGENRHQPPSIGAFPAAKAPNFGSLGTGHRVQCAPRPIGWSQHLTSPRCTEVGGAADQHPRTEPRGPRGRHLTTCNPPS